MNVDVRNAGPGNSALPATNESIEPTPSGGTDTILPSHCITAATVPVGDYGSTTISNELAGESLIYPYCAEPSRPSIGRFSRPTSAREFASQANDVATKVLNGDIDLDTARTYSAIARTVAQAMSAEVARARFLKSLQNLTL